MDDNTLAVSWPCRPRSTSVWIRRLGHLRTGVTCTGFGRGRGWMSLKSADPFATAMAQTPSRPKRDSICCVCVCVCVREISCWNLDRTVIAKIGLVRVASAGCIIGTLACPHEPTVLLRITPTAESCDLTDCGFSGAVGLERRTVQSIRFRVRIRPHSFSHTLSAIAFQNYARQGVTLCK